MLPPSAITFIGGAAGFCGLLIIFFMYITKKACFANAKGCACCADEFTDLEKIDEDEDSEDSEDEIKDIYRKSMRRRNSTRPKSSKSRTSDFGRNGYSPILNEDAESGLDVEDMGSTHLYGATTNNNTSLNERQSPPGSDPKVPQIVVGDTQSVTQSVTQGGTQGGSRPPSQSTLKPNSIQRDGGQTPSSPSNTIPKSRAPSVASLPRAKSPRSQLTNANRVPTPAVYFPEQDGPPQEPSSDDFDVSDLQPEEDQTVISKCGNLLVQFTYVTSDNAGSMSVTIHQGRDIPDKDRGGAALCQVHAVLLPTKQQRFKTKSQPSAQPVFEETVTFKGVPPQDVNNMGIRFRIYGKESLRRERFVGECVVSFASLNLDIETTSLWITMEPRMNLGGGAVGGSKTDDASLSDTSEFSSLSHGAVPELYVGLAYSGTTGRLSVEIIKGSHFRNYGQGRPPDTYVKCSLMSSEGSPIANSKTSLRRGQPNPLFKETFMFQVALFQLPEISLMISVYNKKSMKIKKKEMIGWFSMGFNSSGDEEKSHWEDMVTSNGEQVARWHLLLEA